VADLAEVKGMIEAALPGAEVEVIDETGSGDHLRATVRAPQFAGKTTIDQHRLVRAAVQPRMDDGSIHALSIKTSTAASSASRPGAAGSGPGRVDPDNS
jgi:stress-induced morphogen